MYICIYNEEELSTILIIYSSGFSYQNQLVFPCFFPFKTTTVNNGLQVSLPPRRCRRSGLVDAAVMKSNVKTTPKVRRTCGRS